MNKPILIGLGYRARSGKDTVSNYLVANRGFAVRTMSDNVHRVAGYVCNDNPWAPEFKESITSLGLTGGQLLQQIGMKMREIDKDIWIKALDLPEVLAAFPYVVVNGVRFENEAAEIRRLGGVLVEVWRPGLPEDDHVSEQEGRRIKWDYVLDNSGTLGELYGRVDRLIKWIEEGRQPGVTFD